MLWAIATINFLLLVGILFYFARKPVGKTLDDRRAKIAQAVAEAEELRVTVEKMVREYEAKLAGLDAEVARILKEAKEDGERERVRILARAEETARRIREEALRRAQGEAERIRHKLETEVAAMAVARAREVLQTRMTEREHRAFVDELVSHLEGGNGRGS